MNNIPFYCGVTDTDHLITKDTRTCHQCKREIKWVFAGQAKWPASCQTVEPDAA